MCIFLLLIIVYKVYYHCQEEVLRKSVELTDIFTLCLMYLHYHAIRVIKYTLWNKSFENHNVCIK